MPMSKSSNEEKQIVFSSGQMASHDLPLSQTDVTDITDKCKLMITWNGIGIQFVYNLKKHITSCQMNGLH